MEGVGLGLGWLEEVVAARDMMEDGSRKRIRSEYLPRDLAFCILIAAKAESLHTQHLAESTEKQPYHLLEVLKDTCIGISLFYRLRLDRKRSGKYW